MDTMTLEVTRREDTGKGPNRRRRAVGRVPAVVYGRSQAPVAVELDPKAAIAVLRSPRGQNQVLQLQIDGQPGPLAVVREYQVHPVTRRILHLDFAVVEAGRKITVRVPVKVLGTSKVEKAGGKRRIVAMEINVACAPEHIPVSIDVDVSDIDTTKIVYVTELPYPEGVTPVFKQAFPIASLTAVGGAKAGAGESAAA